MRHLVIVFVAFILSGCSGGPAGPDPGTARFTYAAYTLEGTEILTGVVEIAASDSGGVSGSWEIDWVEGADRGILVGPQIGEGELVGTFAGEIITINLNPDYEDFNVVLYGTRQDGDISGQWSFTGIAGPMYQGTFELRRTSP